MATVNFYLKNPKEKKGETLIYLFFSYDGQRLKYSTGETINPKNWNFENQKVRKSTGSAELNAYLDKLEGDVKKIYRNSKTNEIKLSPEYIRTELIKLQQKNYTEAKKNFFDYFDEYIEINLPTKRLNTINKYKTLLKHLKDFEKEKRIKISFESLDTVFYDKLISYFITDLKLLNNTYKFINSVSVR